MPEELLDRIEKLYQGTDISDSGGNYMNIEIMDTTLRDGEQTEGVAFTKQEKLTLAKKLLQLGVNRIEIASAGATKSTKQEFETVKAICNWAKTKGYLESVEVLAFVGKESIDWVYKTGCRTVNLLCKGSLNHVEGQLKKSKEEHLADIKEVVEYAQSKGMDVNVYLEDWSNGMLNSRDYVYFMIQGLRELHVKRIMLPDTLGILLPEHVCGFVKEIKQKFPGRYDFHAHNDYGLATINTVKAVLAGIDGIHVTVNSLGERTGNASIFEVAVVLKDHYNIDLGLKELGFQGLSDLTAQLSGKKVSHNTPVIGENIDFQTAGIHADGDKKAGLYITKLTPERFGRQGKKYALGKHVGKASIELNLQELGIELAPEQIKTLRDEVSRLGQGKEQITQADLLFLIADLFEQPEMVPFKILECKIKADLNGERSAYVKADHKREILEAESKGDGGYDAAMNAIKKILSPKEIEIPRLVDYSITIPPGGKTSALTMASIGWEHRDKKLQTKGVETDQAFAAIKATEKILNLILRNGNNH